MKKIFLLPLILLTACETTCKPDGSFTRPDLSIKAQGMVAGPAAKNFTPVIKAEAPVVTGQKIVMPKPETFVVAENPKTEKADVTAKLLIEKMELEKLPSGKIDPLQTTSTGKIVAPLTMNLAPDNKNAAHTFRFPEAKDELTPYEQNRLKDALKGDAKKITVTVAPDNSRQGFELLSAVKKRSDLIKSYLPKSAEFVVTFAPSQEANTVRIDF
jgi:hypothetical protein